MAETVVEGDLPADIATALRSAGSIAVDTETSGLDWSVDKLHLCQLFSPETGAILLRAMDEVPAVLSEVLADPAVVKVFHFAPFDLRFLEKTLRTPVKNVACTKAASRLLDPELPASAHSLAPLLQRHLGITITKGRVRTSDWGARTLSEEQIKYAVSDVMHLLHLHAVLVERLESSDLLDLYNKVCAYLPVDSHLAVTGIPDPLHY